jgi:hypothetical protein
LRKQPGGEGHTVADAGDAPRRGNMKTKREARFCNAEAVTMHSLRKKSSQDQRRIKAEKKEGMIMLVFMQCRSFWNKRTRTKRYSFVRKEDFFFLHSTD